MTIDGSCALVHVLSHPFVEPAKPDQGSCRFEVTGLDGTFSRADIPEEKVNHSRHYQVPLDCTWVVTVAEGHRVNVIRNYLVCSITNDRFRHHLSRFN